MNYWYTVGAHPKFRWTPELDAELLRLSSTEGSVSAIARAMGLDRKTIRERADKLQIDLPRGKHGLFAWTPDLDEEFRQLAKTATSISELRRKLGIHERVLKKRAKFLGIELPHGKRGSGGLDWTPEMDQELIRLAKKVSSTLAISRAMGLSSNTLRRRARFLGIELPVGKEGRRRWSAERDVQLKRLAEVVESVSEIAEQMGIAPWTVKRRASFLGIQLPVVRLGSTWNERFDAELINLANEASSVREIAQALNVSWRTAKKHMERLGLELPKRIRFWPFEEAREYVRQQGLLSHADLKQWSKMDRPHFIPSAPNEVYADEWINWTDWLEYPPTEEELIPRPMRRAIRQRMRKPWTKGEMLSYGRAKRLIRQVSEEEGWTSFSDVYKWLRSDRRPEYFPRDPQIFYEDWWQDWDEFLGMEGFSPDQTSGYWVVGARLRQTLPSEPTYRVYHATDRQFSDFLYPEIGFHFAANPNLAVNAAIKAGKRDPVAYAYDISLKNPVEISGQPNRFTAFRVLDDLLDRGIIDAEEHDVAMAQYEEMEVTLWEDELREDSAKLVQNLVRSKGIDGFIYWNEFDAGYNILGTGLDVEPDWSFIVFDNSQIRAPHKKNVV